MNSTLKRVLFWMVLVVVGVLVWKFSTTFQTLERPVAFSDFMQNVDSGKVEQVTIAGHEIAGIYRTDKESFRTYAPSQYDGLAHKLIERGISVTATEPRCSQRKVAGRRRVERALRSVSVNSGGDLPPLSRTARRYWRAVRAFGLRRCRAQLTSRSRSATRIPSRSA